MKKILNVILILVFVVLFYVIFKCLPDFYLNSGKSSYLKKDYTTAYKYLKTAILLSPGNRDIRYYYVQTLVNLKPTFEIQKEIYKISQINQADCADLIADRQISDWRNQIFFSIGENYIERVPFDSKILRWDVTKFPLKVYIKNSSSSAPSYYQESIQKAFLQWQALTKNLINFEFINDDKNANISVEIKSSDDMKKCDQEDCKYTVAYTIPTIYGDLLKKFDIFFYDSNNRGQHFSQKAIYNTALHEIGHALGIMGHSYNKDDIMYMESNQENSYFNEFRSNFQSITQTDLNTLNLLYKIVPNITNTSLSEFDTNRQFFAPIILGTEEQINSRKMIEAQNYIKSAPNLPNGYIDLAAAYAESKEYNNSIDALQKALSFCSNDNEKFLVYYNFAIVYISLKDWQTSLKYADMAKQLDPSSSDADGLVAMINYNLGNREFAKKTYVEAIQKDPANIMNSYNLATVYLKELRVADAAKVLNDLVRANPDAKNDPRIKMYSIIMLLFK